MLIIFDTETYQRLSKMNNEYEIEVRPYAIGYMKFYTKFPDEYKDAIFGENCGYYFAQWLRDQCVKKKTYIQLLGYNLDFDIPVILPDLKVVFDDWEIENPLLSNQGKIISFRMKDPRSGSVIEIKDLWLWNKSRKLADYGSGDVVKLDINYSKWHEVKIDEKNDLLCYWSDPEKTKWQCDKLSKEKEYLMRDIDLTKAARDYIEAEKEAIAKLIGAPGKDTALTAGSYLLSAYNNKLEKLITKDVRYQITLEEYELQKQSYFGGFTTFNNKYKKYICKENESLYYVDVNSMYPYIYGGRNGKGYIIGKRYDEVYDESMFEKYLLVETESRGYIGDLSTELLPFKSKYKTGIAKLLINERLMKLYEEYGMKFKILETRYYEKLDVLVDTTNYLYDEKARFKKEGNITMSGAVKTILNSTYGKFGQGSDLYNRILNIEENLFEKIKVKNKKHFDDEGNVVHIANIMAGVDIAQRSRLLLLTNIKNVMEKGGTVVYADTDSIIFAAPKDTKLSDYVDIGDKMGQFKLEGGKSDGPGKVFTEFYNSGVKKRYMLVRYDKGGKRIVKVATSGISTKIVKEMPYDVKLKFFSEDWNVIVKDGNLESMKNPMHQTYFLNTDYQSNGDCLNTYIYDRRQNEKENNK